MNRYLERLRTVIASSEGRENFQVPIPHSPSEPSKPRSEGFEGTQGMGVSKNQSPDHHLENLKTCLHRTPSKPSEPGVRHSSTAYRQALDQLTAACPDYVPAERWRQCIDDGRRFIAERGRQAAALGWTSDDLFGLHTPPANPHPSYERLSRREHTGLAWFIQGRRVTAMSSTVAAIETPGGGILKYRNTSEAEV